MGMEKQEEYQRKEPYFRVAGVQYEGDTEEDREEDRKYKEEVRKDYLEKLFSHFNSLTEKQQEILRKNEYPKTEEEKEIIWLANQETDQLMREAGMDYFDIPEENFHIVPPNTYGEITGKQSDSSGITYPTLQGICLNSHVARESLYKFAEVILHEVLHLKGHTAIQVEQKRREKEGKPITFLKHKIYRHGLSLYSSWKRDEKTGQEHEHFLGLHEAVVETQAIKSFERLKTHPVFKNDFEWMESGEAQEKKEKIIKDFDFKKGEEEVAWIDKDKDVLSSHPYYGPRKTLDYVCDEIQKQFPEKYPDKDAVFKEFINTQFTGILQSVSRPMEKTFGEGSFRRLGDMNPDDESAYLCLEALQKMRAKKTKKK